MESGYAVALISNKSDMVVCLCRLLNILANFSNLFLHKENSVDPDQTAPRGAVLSGSTLFAKMTINP